MPNQCSADGPGQQLPSRRERSPLVGLSGAMSGANIAMRTSALTMIIPATAPLLRLSRRHASAHSPLGRSSAISLASSSTTLTRRGSSG